MMRLRALSLILLVSILSACSPKKPVRTVHEAAPADYEPRKASVDETVDDQEFKKLDLDELAKAFEADKNLLNKVILPLSRIVLNGKFIENPIYRDRRLQEMVDLFARAYARELERQPRSNTTDLSKEMASLKDKFLNAVFSGCSRDLRMDCLNLDVFGNGQVTEVIVKLVEDEDKQIDSLLSSFKTGEACIEKSERCRGLVENRYRMLAMGSKLRKTALEDSSFSTAYMKHARLFAQLMNYWTSHYDMKKPGMQSSYLIEVHGKIFEGMVSRYNPKNLDDPEFRKFVDNFNPWFYSRKHNDLFRYGTRVMFDLAAQCCLYADKSKQQPSKAVLEAVQALQKDEAGDEMGPSFHAVVESAYKAGDGAVLRGLRMESEISALRDVNSDFYDEFFFIVDRFFRDHIESADALRLIKSANSERARTRLNRVIQTYVRVYMIDMILKTNEYMAQIYTSDKIASDEVFQEAVLRSKEISGKWYAIQNKFLYLNMFAGSYFKGINKYLKEYAETDKLVQSINRNIHYLSVYPNMIVMSYYLAKMKGEITARTWWGAPIKINADKVLESLFSGKVESPWFVFGLNPVLLEREMILYAFYYLLNTQGLEGFVSKDAEPLKQGETERSRFINKILPRYLEASQRDLEKAVFEFRKSYEGQPLYNSAVQLCDYEMSPKGGALSYRISVDFRDLPRFTYSGMGGNGINGVVAAQLNGSGTTFNNIRAALDDQATYVKALLSLIEDDLLRTGKIKQAGDSHPDLDTVRKVLLNIDSRKKEFISLYRAKNEYFLDCYVRLQDIEKRRQRRLYEAEREHLGKVHDILSQLKNITSEEELTAKVNAINAQEFTKEKGYRFDHLIGRSYFMSKYDLLWRIKDRLESQTFDAGSAGDSPSENSHKRTRLVEIGMSGVETDDMVRKPTSPGNGEQISWAESKEEFIRQGMMKLSGKGSPYIVWSSQQAEDQTLMNYVRTLMSLYLVGGPEAVSVDQLVRAYLATIKSATMDAADFELAKEFGLDGNKKREFFEEFLVEKNSHNSLPLFYKLMKDVYDQAGLDLKGTAEVGTAYSMASVLNNLGVFVFTPTDSVRTNLLDVYGSRVNQHFDRLNHLFSELSNSEKMKTYKDSIDEALGRPMFVEGVEGIVWGASATYHDPVLLNNLKVFGTKFARDTGNLYGTKAVLEKYTVKSDETP